MREAVAALEATGQEAQARSTQTHDPGVASQYRQDAETIAKKIQAARRLIFQGEGVLLGLFIRDRLDQALAQRPDDAIKALSQRAGQSGRGPTQSQVEKAQAALVGYLKKVDEVMALIQGEVDAAAGSISAEHRLENREVALSTLAVLQEVRATYQKMEARLAMIALRQKAEAQSDQVADAAINLPRAEDPDAHARLDTAASIVTSENATRDLVDTVTQVNGKLEAALGLLRPAAQSGEAEPLAELMKELREL
jgi:hypothetical protein